MKIPSTSTLLFISSLLASSVLGQTFLKNPKPRPLTDGLRDRLNLTKFGISDADFQKKSLEEIVTIATKTKEGNDGEFNNALYNGCGGTVYEDGKMPVEALSPGHDLDVTFELEGKEAGKLSVSIVQPIDSGATKPFFNAYQTLYSNDKYNPSSNEKKVQVQIPSNVTVCVEKGACALQLQFEQEQNYVSCADITIGKGDTKSESGSSSSAKNGGSETGGNLDVGESDSDTSDDSAIKRTGSENNDSLDVGESDSDTSDDLAVDSDQPPAPSQATLDLLGITSSTHSQHKPSDSSASATEDEEAGVVHANSRQDSDDLSASVDTKDTDDDDDMKEGTDTANDSSSLDSKNELDGEAGSTESDDSDRSDESNNTLHSSFRSVPSTDASSNSDANIEQEDITSKADDSNTDDSLDENTKSSDSETTASTDSSDTLADGEGTGSVDTSSNRSSMSGSGMSGSSMSGSSKSGEATDAKDITDVGVGGTGSTTTSSDGSSKSGSSMSGSSMSGSSMSGSSMSGSSMSGKGSTSGSKPTDIADFSEEGGGEANKASSASERMSSSSGSVKSASSGGSAIATTRTPVP